MRSLGEPGVRVRLLSQPRYLAGARELIDSIARRLGFDDLNAGQVALAVDEALANVIRHGYDRRTDRPIWLSIWPAEATADRPAGMHIVVEDEAKQVDPSKIKSRDLDEVRPGGLGVYLITQIMDGARWEPREEKGMRLLMVKYISAHESGPGEDEHTRATHEDSTDAG